MRVAMVTDIHFGVRNASRYFLDHFETFFRETFFPELEKQNIDTVWVLGDTFDNRTSLNVVALERARKMFFDELEKRGMKVYIILGNHDVYFKSTNEWNSIEVIAKAYSNIHLIRSQETIEFDGTPINFISWVNNANLEDSLEFFKNCPPTVLCGHFEIKSFEMIKGQVNEHGFDKSIFDRFDRVFSGHFHTVSTDGRIFYITNPFQLNWSDYGLDKGFRIFDTKTYDLDFIANPFDIYSKIAYNDEIDIMEFDYGWYANRIVRVYVQSYKSTNQHKLSLFLEKLNQVVHSADLIEIDETEFLNENGEIEYVDNHQLIDRYIEDVVQSPNIDKNILKSMFKEMYQEALELVETE